MGLINDSSEHKAIRDSVAGIAKRYGPEYFLERARTGGGIEELWNDLGAAGLLGLHLPEDYGGGGGGMADAVVVVEELAAQGMPLLIWVISPAICGNILVAPRVGRNEAAMAAADRGRDEKDGVRPDRTRRRVKQPRRQDNRETHRYRLDDFRFQVLHLRGGPIRRDTDGHQGRRAFDGGAQSVVFIRSSNRLARD